MNFQEFLNAKRALQLVEYMDTLSESDALDLFNSFDEETISFIEQVLSEFTAGTIKKMEKRGLSPEAIAAAQKNYQLRPRQELGGRGGKLVASGGDNYIRNLMKLANNPEEDAMYGHPEERDAARGHLRDRQINRRWRQRDDSRRRSLRGQPEKR